MTSDRAVVVAAATRLAVPRVDVPDALHSFVLHAPLELLARGALLPHVEPAARDAALARIDALVANYERLPGLGPAPHLRLASVPAASSALRAALAARDATPADAAAAWFDAHATTDEIVRALAPAVLPALGAAGHGNIYLGLLGRATRTGGLAPMVRPVVSALVADASAPIAVPVAGSGGGAPADLLGVIAGLGGAEPEPLSFIAPLVHAAGRRGVLAALCPADGRFVLPARPAVQLLRVAAQAMLQGPAEHAAYGWTHCLTLAQGALRAGAWAGDGATGTYVAAAYLAAHVAAYAGRPIDLQHQPAPTPLDLREALHASSAVAAGAAWHAPERARTVLATEAAVNHDAHRVKYTLACLEAAADDPAAERLYLAAAAHLHAWWEAHPDDERLAFETEPAA